MREGRKSHTVPAKFLTFLRKIHFSIVLAIDLTLSTLTRASVFCFIFLKLITVKDAFQMNPHECGGCECYKR